MATTGFISVELVGGDRTAGIFPKLQQEIKQPFAGARGRAAINRMQKGGAGSVEDMFDRQGHYAPFSTSFVVWREGHDFGTRKKSAKTLRSDGPGGGKYRAAWIGEGSGSVHSQGNDFVSIGVDGKQFPQVFVFQRFVPTKQAVTRKQRSYLGMTYDVWLRQGTVLTNYPRPLRIGAPLMEAIRRGLVQALVTGDASAIERAA